MKNILFVFLFSFISYAQNDTLIFLLFGQSNMAGYGLGDYTVASNHSLIWRGSWVHLEDPLINDFHGSLAPSFTNYLVNNYDSTNYYAVVCGAVGAKGITDTWSNTSNTFYIAARDSSLHALNGKTPNGILFWAGEQDIYLVRDSLTIYDSTIAMINHYRDTYGDSVPMIFVLPSRSNYKNADYEERSGIRSAVENSSFCYLYIDAAELPTQDDVHQNARYLDTVGMALARCWINLQSSPSTINRGIVGTRSYVKFNPKYLVESCNFSNFLYVVDMSKLSTTFWQFAGTSDTTIGVFNHRTNLKIPRIIKNYNRTTRTGVLYFSSSMDAINKTIFTIEAGMLSEHNDTSLLTNCNIVQYYPMDEGSGDSAHSLFERNCLSLTNCSWITGKLTNSVYFNGSNAVAISNSSIIPTGNIRVEIVYRSLGASLNESSFNYYHRLLDNSMFFYIHRRTSPSFAYIFSNGSTNASFPFGINMDSIYSTSLIARSSDGITTLYSNGFWVDTNKATGDPQAGTTNLRVGNSYAVDRHFNGSIEHLAVYNELTGNVKGWAMAKNHMFRNNWFDQQAFIIPTRKIYVKLRTN